MNKDAHAHLSPDDSIPVVEERLEVGRRTVDPGTTLRVRKQVQDVPVQVRQALSSDRVDVTRVAIGRVITEPAQVRREGAVTIVPVVEERLVTRKELVLVEEIHLTHRHEVHEAQATVDLRRERVVIERFDPQTRQWLPEQDE